MTDHTETLALIAGLWSCFSILIIFGVILTT